LIGERATAQTNTTLAVTAAGAPVTATVEGTVVTLTATVTAGGSPVTPGQVNFCEAAPPHCTDIHLVGMAQLTKSGTATMRFTPGPGSHLYQAYFLGTRTQLASSSPASSLSVSPYYPTSTSIAASGFVGNATLTATVTSTEGTLSPTGTVTFMDTDNANYVLGTASLPAAAANPSPSGLSFLNSSSTPTRIDNTFVTTADFNGDGKLDLAVAGFNSTTGSSVGVFLGNGDGTFSQAQPPPIVGPANQATSIAAADFNGDGIPDMAVTLPGLGSQGQIPIPAEWGRVQILLGNGDGTFAAAQAILETTYNTWDDEPFVAAGDFNGDGIPDLAVASGGNLDSDTVSAPGTVTILLGKGDGTFTLKSTAATGVVPLSIAVGDFNGDGKADLAVADAGGATGATSVTSPGAVTILLGNGDGTFTPSPVSPATGPSPVSVTAGDFNRDGTLDLAVANSYNNVFLGLAQVPGTVTILLGDGDGTFTQSPQSPVVVVDPNSIAVGDFNGDGKPDLVTEDGAVYGNQTSSGALSVLLGNGDGTFAPATSVSTVSNADFAGTGDFNGDGLSDIAVAEGVGRIAGVYLARSGPQSATASVNGISIVGTGTHYVDVSYSGDSEYQPSLSGTIPLIAEPVPTVLTFTANPTATAYGQQVVLTASIAPNLAQNHNASGTVTFSNGSTTLGTGTVAKGIATLTISNLTVGTDTLTAAYSGDVNFVASTGTATEIVTGTPTTTSLTAAPNPAFLSQTVTLTATVSSAGSGSSATPAGTITFYNGSTMLGTATLTAGTVAGSASANFTTSTLALGTHSLSAVYANNGPYYGSTGSASETITTAPSSTLLTASPNPTGVGQTVTLTATVTGTGAPSPPAGTVTFYDGTTPLGTATLNASDSATFTVSTLALGTHALTAVYAVSGPYSGSTSAVVSETIDAPDFTISLANPTLTIETYHHTTTSVTLTSLFGFSDKIALTCTNPPQYVTCVFTPNSTVLPGTATVSLYLDTDSIVGAGARNEHRPVSPFALAFLLAPLTLLAKRRWMRGRGVRLLAVLSTVLLSIALGACSSNVSLIPAAAPGTYVIPITATGATTNLSHSASLTLTVTP
jgi:hypothetical protein